jgi:ATP-binding cassette subfamily B multidrug efflux pump
MPEDKSPPQPKQPEKQAAPQQAKESDDVVGKAYDGRLMRRLLTYLRPYKLQTGIAALAILIKAGADVAGPFLVAVAVDTYMSGAPPAHLTWLTRHLSPSPMLGITQIAAIYLASLLFTFLLELLQTYLMQWTGQKVMFDMRSQIFRHLQLMSPAFFDHNPVGRLVTRVTSDVDALNEMFTSGVLAIFDNVFVLLFIVAIMVRMNWSLALLTLSVIPAILFVTKIFRKQVRESYRRQRAATARINSFTQEYVSGMSVVQLFNRERAPSPTSPPSTTENKRAWEQAIFAYAWYYPVVELLSSVAIALVLWRGGYGILHKVVDIGILIAFIQYAQRFFRPFRTSAKSTTSSRPPWPPASASSNSSTPNPPSSPPPTPSPATPPAPSNSATSGSPTNRFR